MKIAILYYGLIRGFKYQHVLDSHQKYLWNEIESQGHSFDTFISTYDKDYDETNVLKVPNLKKLLIVSDKNTENNLKNMVNLFTCPMNFTEETKMNLLKSWKSQETFISIMQNEEEYDLYIMTDIAQKMLTPLDLLSSLKTDTLYTPNFSEHTGLNDRMMICNKENMIFICDKLNYLCNQEPKLIMCSRTILRKNKNCNLHPESAYKLLITNACKKHNKLKKIKFWRIRTDGTAIKDI